MRFKNDAGKQENNGSDSYQPAGNLIELLHTAFFKWMRN